MCEVKERLVAFCLLRVKTLSALYAWELDTMRKNQRTVRDWSWASLLLVGPVGPNCKEKQEGSFSSLDLY